MTMSKFRPNKIHPNVCYAGQVLDNNDPKQQGRIRVHIPGVLEFSKPEHYPWCVPDWHHTDGSTNWSGSFDVPKLNAIVGIYFQETPDVEGSAYHPTWTAHNLLQPQILTDAKHHYPNRKVHWFANGARAIIDTEDDSVWLYNPGEVHAKSKGKMCIKAEQTFVILSDVEVGIRAPEIALRAKNHLIMESEDKITMRCKGRMNIESRDDIRALARLNVMVTAAERNIELLARADKSDLSEIKLTTNKDSIKLDAKGMENDRPGHIDILCRKNHIKLEARGINSPRERSSFLLKVKKDLIDMENEGSDPSSAIRIEHKVQNVTVKAAKALLLQGKPLKLVTG